MSAPTLEEQLLTAKEDLAKNPEDKGLQKRVQDLEQRVQAKKEKQAKEEEKEFDKKPLLEKLKIRAPKDTAAFRIVDSHQFDPFTGKPKKTKKRPPFIVPVNAQTVQSFLNYHVTRPGELECVYCSETLDGEKASVSMLNEKIKEMKKAIAAREEKEEK